MENLNAENIVNEIRSLIKALKDCGGWVKRGNGEGWFNHEILADALALINSQEQRIKELTEDKEKLGYLIDELVKEKRELWEENKKLTEENERLKAPKYYIHSDDRIEMIPTVESVRADTVRKMQERLKADAVTIQDHTGKLGVVVGVGNIDDVAREMLEGENEN